MPITKACSISTAARMRRKQAGRLPTALLIEPRGRTIITARGLVIGFNSEIGHEEINQRVSLEINIANFK